MKGWMTMTENEPTRRQFNVALTDDERTALSAEAARLGLSLASFMRMAALDRIAHNGKDGK